MEQVEQIELQIEEAEKSINLAAALDRLYKNEDFKLVFLDGYFKEEASRAVLLRADPNMQIKERQRDINNIITSIGGLRQYFAKIFGMGTMAEKAIAEDKAEREQILQEEIDDGLDTIQ